MERIGQPATLGLIRNVLVAADDALWQVEVGAGASIARQRLDRVVIGDPQNSARFVINRYGNAVERLPISRLVYLAAYAILMAGEEHPHGVGGLELVLIPKGGEPIFLTPAQENKLKTEMGSTDRVIRKRLTRAFTYDVGQ